MKNIILQLITIFFAALIGWHIYNAYFGKTLEGMEGRTWEESKGLSEDVFDTTGGYAPASAAGQRHQMQVEVKTQDIFNKNNELIKNLTAFKQGLDERISILDIKALQIVKQTKETRNALDNIIIEMNK